MNLVRRLFPFRTCTIDIKDGERALQRPCLLYHIKRCQGPCIEAISKADYRADIEQVELFLEGRQETLVKALRQEMAGASERQEYERAASLRDKVRAIERTMESQKMAAFAKADLDMIGLARQDNQAAAMLFVLRDGKMIGRDVYLLDAARDATDDEVLASFLEQFYARATSIPREVYVPASVGESETIQAFLAERRGGPVHLRVPQRGEKRELMALATRNAEEHLAREQARWLADQGKTLAALEQLADALGLAGPPLRIECYDISNFQGAESVGSMVVFEDGKPRSGEYRRFRIRTVEGPNDFASHQEVLRRRFRVTRTGEEGNEEARRWAMPDLVIVDGGKGQVSAAKAVLDELGPARPAAGGPGQGARGAVPARPVRPDRPAADLAGALPRPAAARRGPPLRHHLPPRAARQAARSARRSTTCPASGPKRRRELLKVFGSIKRVREAPVEQIAAVPGHRPGAGRADQGDARGLNPVTI